MFKLLYQPYKWLFFVPYFALNTVVICSIITQVCKLSPQWANRVLARYWAKSSLLLTPATVDIKGTEYISAGQSYIVVANHASQYDILALYGWLNIRQKWVMKEELRKVPTLGKACESMGHVFIDRAKPKAAAAALQKGQDELLEGESLIFFPEGSRSENGSLGGFKRGAFVVAKEMQLPILPITVKGTESILPSNTLNLMPGRAEITIHQPIAAEVVKESTATALRSSARSVIASAL